MEIINPSTDALFLTGSNRSLFAIRFNIITSKIDRNEENRKSRLEVWLTSLLNVPKKITKKNAPNVHRSPCAKLISFIVPKYKLNPIATSEYIQVKTSIFEICCSII